MGQYLSVNAHYGVRVPLEELDRMRDLTPDDTFETWWQSAKGYRCPSELIYLHERSAFAEEWLRENPCPLEPEIGYFHGTTIGWILRLAGAEGTQPMSMLGPITPRLKMEPAAAGLDAFHWALNRLRLGHIEPEWHVMVNYG